MLTTAVLAALAYARWIALVAVEPRRFYLFYYYVPIAVPFVAFLFDRAERGVRRGRSGGLVDIIVVSLALARTQVKVPLTSGHALFLAYALGTVNTPAAWWSAAVVMVEVVILKTAWGDASLIGGIVLGALAAWWSRRET